ncbi:MAG: hypothetical protein J3Q66DRAFT_80784 [Benniella sp.]|nr:MAG: hypothetical protein J3Q66DRAFT_80784 [Benniella sp.]
MVTASYTFSGGARIGLTAATVGGGMEDTSSNFSAHGSQSVSSQDQGAQPAAKDLGVTLSESSLNDNINCEEDDNDNDGSKGQYRTITTFGEHCKTHEQAKRGSIASVSTLTSQTSSAAPEERGTYNGEGGHLPRLFLGPGVLALDGPDSPTLDDDDNGNGYGDDVEGVLDPGTFSSSSSSPPSSPLTHSSRGSSNSVSPVSSRQQRPRPYSQFPTGRSLFHDLHSRPLPSLSNTDDNSLFMDRNVPLRRANSLPASRRSHSFMRTTQVARTPLLSGFVASTFAGESQGDDKSTTPVEPTDHQQLPQRYSEGIGTLGNDHTQHFARPQSIIVNTGPSLKKASVIDLSVPPRATVVPPVVGSDAATTGSAFSQLETNRPTTERPRRQSLLSPRQLQIMGQQQQHQPQLQHGNEATTFRVGAQPKVQTSTPGSGGTNSRRGVLTNFIKDHGKKQKDKSRSGESSAAQPTTATESKRSQKNKQPPHQQLKPSVKNMPNITFLPHSTEISASRPSVSGRLLLHIPRLDGYKFHFVSLKLYLRLKESISWIRQDLVSFEIEKHQWGQTVWEKKTTLAFEDKQVDERNDSVLGTEGTAAVLEQGQLRGPSPVTASLDPNLSSSTTNTSQDHSNTPLGAAATSLPGTKSDTPVVITSDPADQWYWEWLLPVTKQEARPESFEGSMGSVWYELEAKCLFRWDCVDKDGNVILPGSDLQSQNQAHESSVGANASLSSPSKAADVGQGKSQSGSNKLLKSLGVFGKLRVGGKSKKPQYAGDFKMPSQHEEYIKDSLRKAGTGAPAQDSSHKSSSYTSIFSLAFGKDEPQEQPSTPNQGGAPLPFQIRKSLKLYFTRTPSEISSNPAIFLPPPSMSLPALSSTRRLKAIIPGARIQVQIQVPSMVPIPGYVHTSQLVPCTKTGVLILNKSPSGIGSATANKLAGGCHGHIQASGNAIITGAHPDESYIRPHLEDSMRYPDDFQVVLTVRRVTQRDIKKCDILRRRYENAEAVANAANQHANIPPTSSTSQGPYMLKRLLSHQSSSSHTDATEEPSDVSGFTASGSSDSGQRSTGQDRAWRKDIRVRKVKCEFWQKENCR